MKSLRWSYSLNAYLLSLFLPVFLVSASFFVLILEMADLLANIVQYVQNDVSVASMAKVAALFAPKCLSWALPIAMLFSVSFTVGTLFANNELIVVYGSGIPLFSFMMPVFVLSALLSAGFLYFEDAVVVPTYAQKTALSKSLLKTGEAPEDTNNITILAGGGKLVWNIRYYDRVGLTMTGVTIVERDDDGGFVSRTNAQTASWTGDAWNFNGVRRFFWKDGYLTDQALGSWSDSAYNEHPDTFKGGGKPSDELKLAEARIQISLLKKSGLPSAALETRYLQRYAYALVPLLVSLLSAALAGWFRKNILLMSLLVSLSGAVVYYVSQMITSIMAESGTIPPWAGAFLPLLLFLALIASLFKLRQT